MGMIRVPIWLFTYLLNSPDPPSRAEGRVFVGFRVRV